MPTIRRYERQVLPQPVGQPAAVPDAFGAGTGRAMVEVGRAIGRTGEVVGDIAQERRDRRDKAHVRDVLNQAIEQDREFMGGQYSKEGADGTGVYDESKKYFEDSKRRWMQQLESQQQQELFAQAYDPRANSHLDGALRHQNKQIEVYDTATKNAFVAQTTNDAVLMRKDPEYVAVSLAEVTATTRDLYRHMGKEVADAMVLDAQGRFHAAVIEADIEDNPAAAKKYFEGAVVQTQIPEKLKAVLKQKIDRADLRSREQQRADEIMSASADPRERLGMARKSPEDIRDGAVSRVKARNAEEKFYQEQAEQAMLAEKTNAILDIKSLEGALDIADTVENGKSRLELTRLAHSLYGTDKDKIKTDQAKMLEARIRIDRGEMPSIETLWMEYKPHAADADWKQLENYYRSGGAAAGLKDSNVRSIYKSLTGKDATDKPKKYNRVWDYVQRNMPEGRKPTDEEVRGLVGQALIEGYIPVKNWWDTEMTYGEALETGQIEQWVPDIPEEDEDRAIQQLNRVGIPVTPERIRKFYLHEMKGVPRPAAQPIAKPPPAQTPAGQMTDAELDARLQEMGAPVDANNREVLRRNLAKEKPDTGIQWVNP